MAERCLSASSLAGPATSGSWRTSTPARPPPPSGSCTTRAATTRSARSTRAATMDWMVQEQERGITITSAATTAAGVTRGSTSSTPGPRRLHRRGGAEPARPRRRRRRLRCRGRRRAPDRDRLAPGEQVHVPRICFVNKMTASARTSRTVEMIKDDSTPTGRHPAAHRAEAASEASSTCSSESPRLGRGGGQGRGVGRDRDPH